MIARASAGAVTTIGTYDLARRWNLTQRTVIRLCRLHKLREIRMDAGIKGHDPRGKILYLLADVLAMEAKVGLVRLSGTNRKSRQSASIPGI